MKYLKLATFGAITTLVGSGLFMAPASAHTWQPSDGGSNYRSQSGNCDGAGISSDFPRSASGRICFTPWFYDHGQHLHIDHVQVQWNGTTGMSQTRDHRLIRVDRVRLRIFEGVCATTYPRCAGSLTLVSDRQFGTNTSGAFLINFGAQINGPRGYMVADWDGSFRDPRTGTSYAFGDQEEGAFG